MKAYRDNYGGRADPLVWKTVGSLSGYFDRCMDDHLGRVLPVKSFAHGGRFEDAARHHTQLGMLASFELNPFRSYALCRLVLSGRSTDRPDFALSDNVCFYIVWLALN